MDAVNRTERRSLDALMEKATDFHGHFGPFLALGVRMGLIGLRELEAKEGDKQLNAAVTLEYKVPYSCLIDGVQATTKCTIGNQRLKWKESKQFAATFTLKNKGRSVRVIVNPSLVKELTTKLAKEPSEVNVRQLGSEVASRLEKELFLVRASRIFSFSKMNIMQDLDKAKNLLKQNDSSLVIVNNGRVVFETRSSGMQGLLEAVKKAKKELKGSAVADKIVGEAAAQVFAYSNVNKVFAVTLSKCGKDVLRKNHVGYEYENLVPHILNMKKTELCPFEKIVMGSKGPEEAYLRLKQSVQMHTPK